MKYIYSDNLELITVFHDEVENEKIKELYINSYITDKELKNAKLVDGQLAEKTQEELNKEKFTQYQKGQYTLEYDEIIKGEKIEKYELQEYETIKNGVVVYDTERKKADLLGQAKNLKNEMGEQGFIFRENLRQPCREQDKTSVTAKVLELQFTRQPSCEWKFFDKDTGEHIYKTITLEELAQLGLKIGQIILQSMKAESRVIEELKHISDEDLKTYDVYSKF